MTWFGRASRAVGALGACALFPFAVVPGTPAADRAPLATHGLPVGATADLDGKKLYERCVACHQATGAGIPNAFPPLGGSEYVTGKPEVPIAILLHGIQGELTVKGAKYNGVMMQYGTGQAMTDQEIADVVTYIRTNFGNKATPVTVKDVAAAKARHAARKKPFSEAELRALMK
jgi:mono/diheme cytochrome c family protein